MTAARMRNAKRKGQGKEVELGIEAAKPPIKASVARRDLKTTDRWDTIALSRARSMNCRGTFVTSEIISRIMGARASDVYCMTRGCHF
jgi:hypothetical protein